MPTEEKKVKIEEEVQEKTKFFKNRFYGLKDVNKPHKFVYETPWNINIQKQFL